MAHSRRRWVRVSRRTLSSPIFVVTAVLAIVVMFLAGAAGGQVEQTVEGFEDVSRGSTHANGIGWLARTGIATGVEDGLFRPSAPIPRWEMAVWLIRALTRPDPDPQPGGRVRFADMDARFWYAAHVEVLATRRITAGCATGPLRFCPDRAVTRGEVATFLVRAFRLPAADEDAAPPGFTDTAGSFHAANIDRLWHAGVTAGCDTGRFCPSRSVTRGEMATFLFRAVTRGEKPASATTTTVGSGGPTGTGSSSGSGGGNTGGGGTTPTTVPASPYRAYRPSWALEWTTGGELHDSWVFGLTLSGNTLVEDEDHHDPNKHPSGWTDCHFDDLGTHDDYTDWGAIAVQGRRNVTNPDRVPGRTDTPYATWSTSGWSHANDRKQYRAMGLSNPSTRTDYGTKNLEAYGYWLRTVRHQWNTLFSSGWAYSPTAHENNAGDSGNPGWVRVC